MSPKQGKQSKINQAKPTTITLQALSKAQGENNNSNKILKKLFQVLNAKLPCLICVITLPPVVFPSPKVHPGVRKVYHPCDISKKSFRSSSTPNDSMSTSVQFSWEKCRSCLTLSSSSMIFFYFLVQLIFPDSVIAKHVQSIYVDTYF